MLGAIVLLLAAGFFVGIIVGVMFCVAYMETRKKGKVDVETRI